MPIVGMHTMKHFPNMKGTLWSGGKASPPTRQQHWFWAFTMVVTSTMRQPMHRQVCAGVPVLQQQSHSRP